MRDQRCFPFQLHECGWTLYLIAVIIDAGYLELFSRAIDMHASVHRRVTRIHIASVVELVPCMQVSRVYILSKWFTSKCIYHIDCDLLEYMLCYPCEFDNYDLREFTMFMTMNLECELREPYIYNIITRVRVGFIREFELASYENYMTSYFV